MYILCWTNFCEATIPNTRTICSWFCAWPPAKTQRYLVSLRICNHFLPFYFFIHPLNFYTQKSEKDRTNLMNANKIISTSIANTKTITTTHTPTATMERLAGAPQDDPNYTTTCNKKKEIKLPLQPHEPLVIQFMKHVKRTTIHSYRDFCSLPQAGTNIKSKNVQDHSYQDDIDVSQMTFAEKIHHMLHATHATLGDHNNHHHHHHHRHQHYKNPSLALMYTHCIS